MVKLVISITLFFLLAGCATIFKGDKEVIQASSDPEGAEVFIDGVSYGKTPVDLTLDVTKSYTVIFRYEDQERTVVIKNNIGTLWIVLDILGAGIPLIVDAITGDWYELSPDEVSVTFN